MNTLKRIASLGAVAFFFASFIACNSATEGQESDPTPAEDGLSERYNINAPDEELMNVDSADADSSIDDTILDNAQ